MNTKLRWFIEICIGGLIMSTFIFYIVSKSDMQLLKEYIIAFSELSSDTVLSNESAKFILVTSSLLSAFVIKLSVELFPKLSQMLTDKL